MLPKVNRADKKTLDIFFSSDPNRKKVFRTAHSTLFSVKSTETDTKESRFTFVVSSSVEKTAVGRNLLKRRARAIVAKSLNKLKGGHVVMFIFKKPAVTAEFKDLEKEIELVFPKIGLI